MAAFCERCGGEGGWSLNHYPFIQLCPCCSGHPHVCGNVAHSTAAIPAADSSPIGKSIPASQS